MARYMIAYVSPGLKRRDEAWVLGAIANDESGFAVSPNPDLDLPAVAAATKLEQEVLEDWAEVMNRYIRKLHKSVYDPQTKEYVPMPPTAPDFLGVLAAEVAGQQNYHYSNIQEQPGSAAEVAAQKARGNGG